MRMIQDGFDEFSLQEEKRTKKCKPLEAWRESPLFGKPAQLLDAAFGVVRIFQRILMTRPLEGEVLVRYWCELCENISENSDGKTFGG